MGQQNPFTREPQAKASAPHLPARPWRVAVIGGGLSGLAAAHRLGELCRDLERALDLTLFEAGGRLGGVVETRRYDESLVEMGADSFITDKPQAVDLCRRLGLQDRIMATDERFRRSLVVRQGRPVPVPQGFNLLAPAKLWPVVTSPILSPWGKLRVGWEYFIPRREIQEDEDESLASFVRRRLGREAFERLVQPLVGGIYTADPDKLSLRATLPRFLEMERRYGSLIRALRRERPRRGRIADGGSRFSIRDPQSSNDSSGARYGLFATLAGGLSELVETLRRQLAASATIRLNTPVERVQSVEYGTGMKSQEGEWRAVIGDPQSPILSFDALILAVPAYRAADLLQDVGTPLADRLREIEYASSAIVVTGHRLADIRHPLDGFGLVVPAVEKRNILAVSFSSRKFAGRAPPGHVLLRTFLGGALQPELLERSDEELIDVVRSELADLLGISGREEWALVARHDWAMPQYHVGHLDRLRDIERRVGQYFGLALAGNAYHGVGIPDCIRSGEQAAERVFTALKVEV